MKSFDEWFEGQDIDNWTNKKFMLKAFEAGQQSKQAEVDELQKRIDGASSKSKDFYDFGDGESAMAFCSEIIDILKGDQS